MRSANTWDSTRFGEQLRPESPVHPSMEPRVDSRPAMMRHQFNPDVVAYMGASEMMDGRTMMVFEENGQRRAIAIRGSIQELNHAITEREMEWTRKKLQHAEACLETIYRPSQPRCGIPADNIDAKSTPADEYAAAPFVEKTVAEEPLPMASVEPEPQFDMGRAAERRTYPTRSIIDDVDIDPIPEYLGRVKVHEIEEGRD